MIFKNHYKYLNKLNNNFGGNYNILKNKWNLPRNHSGDIFFEKRRTYKTSFVLHADEKTSGRSWYRL